MKSREDILSKIQEVKSLEETEVNLEVAWILSDIAGDDEDDMRSSEGIEDLMSEIENGEYSYSGDLKSQLKAVEYVCSFLNN